jgi:hypothetical protein
MNMQAKNTLNLITTVIAVCLITAPAGASYAQDDQASPKEGNGTKTVIEQALKNYEEQKQNEQDEIAAQLNFRLGQATESWITSIEKERDKQLGTFIEQDWDKQPRTAIILPPIRYEYYLRGYKYTVTDSDVIKTDSVTSPYKAIVIVREELYSEKYHHPNTSDTKLFFYTVTNTYTLDFSYRDGEFNLVSSDNKMDGIVNEISSQARKQWIK